MSTPTDNLESYETFKYGGGWPEIVEIPVHDSFPQFSRLTIELRLKIWAFARYHQQPRIIEADHYSTPIEIEQNPGPEGYPRASREWCCVSPCGKIFPPGFHVCREARQEMMRYYTWLPWRVWFDYERDYLYFGENLPVTEMHDFITDVVNIDVKKLRYLAIFDQIQPVLESFDKDFLKELLKNLEELTAVYGIIAECSIGNGEDDWQFEACDYSYMSTDSCERRDTEDFEKLERFLRSFKKSTAVEDQESSSDWSLPELQARSVVSP